MTTVGLTGFRPSRSPKEQYLDTLEQEFEKTRRVLRAYPREKSELKPHPKAKTARELAFTFVVEQVNSMRALTTGFDWSRPQEFPSPPGSFEAVVEAIEDGHRKLVELVRSIPEQNLLGDLVQFPLGPGRVVDVPRIQFLWTILCDQIHHRGQLTVYLRMADGRGPSIHGPSLDEPW